MYEIINEEQQLKDFDFNKITPESLGLKATNDFALYANEKIVSEMPEESKQWVSKGPIGVLEAGQMYADEMNEFDGTYVNITPEKEQGAWSNSVDERIARNFEKKEQRDKRIKEGNGSFFDKVGAFMDKVGDDSLKAQKEQAQKVQDRQMPNKDNSNYRYEFKSINKAGQPVFVERNLAEKIDFAEALNESLTSGESLPFIGSQVKRGKAKKILDIKNKIKNNEEITQEELNYFNRFKNREYEKQLRGYTTGGEIGANWLPSMLAFGGEIAVGGWILKGLGLAGKGIGAGSNLAKTLLKSGKVNKAAAGALGFASGQIAEGGLNALVGGSVAGLSGGFWANYNERKLNDTMKITDRGTVVFREASETPAKAFVKSMASLYISYFAESMGSLLGAPIKAGSKLIGNTSTQAFKKVLENCPKLEEFIKKSAPLLAKAYEKLNNLPVKGKSAEWLKNQVKFDGFLEEIGEELLEDVLNLSAGINNEERSLENYIKTFHKTPEEWAVLTGMIALQGTTLSVAGNLVGHIMQNNGVEDEKILETLSNTSEAERLEIIGEAIENGSLNVSEIESEESRAESFRQAMEKEAYDKFIEFGINEKQAAATAMLHGVQAMNLLKEGNSEEDIRKQLSFELSNKTVEEITKGAQALNQKDFVGIAGANENEVEDAQREWQEKGTESKYFKKWFGDSKVVDEAGKPLVVYHGTNRVFNKFKKGKRGYLGKGIYLTNKKSKASRYTDYGEQGIMPLYLKLENPLIIEERAGDVPRAILEVLGKEKTYEKRLKKANDNQLDVITNSDIKKLQELGYDGIAWKVGSETEYNVFNPEQIKSVDNRGTFDAENPNIYYQALEFKFIDEIKKNIQKMDKKVLDFQKMKIFEPIKHYFDVIKDVPVKNMTQDIKNKLGLEDNSMGAYNPLDKTIYLNYDLINQSESTALLHTFIHEAEHAKQKELLKFAYNNIDNPNLSAKEKYQLHLFLMANNRNDDAINALFDYIGLKGFKSTEEFDYKARDLYNNYKKAPMELMADNIALVMQYEIGDRNEEQISHFRGEYRSILENGADEVHVRKGILSKNWAIQNIGAYNERIANETRRISDTGILYQTNENQQEPLIAGYTAQEIFERLQALEDEYGDFTDNTPKEIIDNHNIKIQVLTDALDYMYRENRIQKDFDEIAYNTYHIMNNAPLPEAFVEANKNTQRTIRDYEEIVRAKKEQKENEYLGYYTNQDNKNIIGLSEIADVSTLPHELAHLYLNAMNELAKTNAKTRERLDEVNNWLGYDGNSYTVAQQEKFAVGYEAYLYNGKAPNSILKEVFENFKEWLKSTYTYIRTQNIEFSPEAEAIFDKMFGADDYIQKKKASEDLLKRIKSKDVSKKKKANLEKEEKPSEYSEKYKNTAYVILETATGKSRKYLKSILETESNTQSTAKKREKLLRELDEVGDSITVNGFDPSWGEFFNFKANEDYTLAKEAFDVILNKTYLNEDKLSLYENDYAQSIRDSIDETDIEYKKLLSAYKKGNRDVALATYYDWIETINPEIKRDYEERFYNDSRNIDKIENQSDIARAKERIIKRAFEVENRYGINSDTGYVEMVKQTLGSLKFLTPVDKARIATNILDVNSLDMLLGRVDSILDIAKTMQDVSYRNKLNQDIHKELQLTKNVKKGARTVGKYDYKTNKIFERLREIDALSPEQAQELKQNMADIIRKKEAGELSYEDVLINKFIKYKADGRTFADSELMKSIYDEILKIKLIGKTAKNEQELQDKINGSKEIDELAKIVSSKKKGNLAIKTYIQTMGNFETLMHAFFNKKVAQEYADELLYAETEAQVFQNEQKQRFQSAVAKIYNLPLWNFDKKIIEFLGTKFEYDEYRREYDKDKNLIKTQTFKKELTKMDLILAFMWSRNDTLKARLINQFGQQQLDDMIEQLDNKDIQFANLMMSTAQSFYPLVNQAYIKKYGFDLPRVSCYFPSTPERGTELDMFNDYGARSKNDSFSKQRAASEIVPMDFGNPVAILYNHIDGVAKFAIIGTQIDKANTILNNQTFLKPAIINTYGKDAYRTLQQTLLNVTYKAESQVYNGFSKVINTLTSNWIQANIAFKPLVAIKQFISANNYASIMPAGEWALRFSQSALDWKKTVEYMWKIPYVRARYQGSYTNEFLQSTIENSAFAVTGKLKDFMALNVKLGDLGSLVFGGKPYIDYLISQGKTEQEAIKQFVLETNKMQQSSAVSTLSNFQVWASRQPLARPFTAYRNSQQQYARKCGDAIVQYCNGDISKSEMCKTIFHFMFLQPFVFALFTSGSLITLAMSGDDDDLKQDAILSLSNLCIDAVPILHDIYLHALKKLVLHDYSPVNTLPLWGDIEKEISRLAKEDVPLEDYLYSLGYILGNVGTGVNITTVGNTIGGMGDIITDDWLKGVLRLIGYSDFRAGRMTGNEPKKKKRKYSKREK